MAQSIRKLEDHKTVNQNISNKLCNSMLNQDVISAHINMFQVPVHCTILSQIRCCDIIFFYLLPDLHPLRCFCLPNHIAYKHPLNNNFWLKPVTCHLCWTQISLLPANAKGFSQIHLHLQANLTWIWHWIRNWYNLKLFLIPLLDAFNNIMILERYTQVTLWYTVAYSTCALDFPTCLFWNKNWRFKLLTSIVSRSI